MSLSGNKLIILYQQDDDGRSRNATSSEGRRHTEIDLSMVMKEPCNVIIFIRLIYFRGGYKVNVRSKK